MNLLFIFFLVDDVLILPDLWKSAVEAKEEEESKFDKPGQLIFFLFFFRNGIGLNSSFVS